MKKFAIFILLGVMVCASPHTVAEQRVQSGLSTHRLESDGIARWFKSYVPSKRPVNGQLVILLHGGTGDMSQVMASPLGLDWQELSNQHGFILIAPNGMSDRGNARGTKQHWNDYRQPSGQTSQTDDVAFILKTIEWAVKTQGIDRRKVYVNGISNGGMMTFRLLQDAPDAFAGGGAYVANLPASTPPSRGAPTPIILIHGTDDPMMKWEGGNVGRRSKQDKVVSASQTVQHFVDRNSARAVPLRRIDLPDRFDDGCRLELSDYGRFGDGVTVRSITMHGGGHLAPSPRNDSNPKRLKRRLSGTPCRDASAAKMAWNFFQSF